MAPYKKKRPKNKFAFKNDSKFNQNFGHVSNGNISNETAKAPICEEKIENTSEPVSSGEKLNLYNEIKQLETKFNEICLTNDSRGYTCHKCLHKFSTAAFRCQSDSLLETRKTLKISERRFAVENTEENSLGLCSDNSKEPSQIETDGLDDEQEVASDYTSKGGYYPVEPLEVFNSRYVTIRKVGWGHFSTVWLSWDTIIKCFVALKIIKSARHYTEAAEDEIKILKKIQSAFPEDPGRRKCVEMIDSFRISSTRSEHICMVFEVLGCNLLKLLIDSSFKGICLENVRTITHNVLLGLDYLHTKCSIIHTDIKPENVLLVPTEHEVFYSALSALKKLMLGQELMSDAVCNYPPSFERNVPKTQSEDDINLIRLTMIVQITDLVDSSREFYSVISRSQFEIQMAKAKRLLDSRDFCGDFRANAFVELLSSISLIKPEVRDLVRRPSKSLEVKIADLGNACWTFQHFSEQIQTRQYRSIEVILKSDYNMSADIWSTACMIFELITGDFLFNPQSTMGISKNGDHLELICELLGPIPSEVLKRSKEWYKYFSPDGNLINCVKVWPLMDVLSDKYNLNVYDNDGICSLILPMLALDYKRRPTAFECLDNEWLHTSF